MRRQIRMAVLVVSISMCAAVLTLWLRSKFLLDSVLWKNGSISTYVALCEADSTHGNHSITHLKFSAPQRLLYCIIQYS
jgi:hypothetical protein